MVTKIVTCTLANWHQKSFSYGIKRYVVISDVNKDLTFKAKDKDKDQTLKAKDQDKDQTPKDKDMTRTRPSRPRTRTRS